MDNTQITWIETVFSRDRNALPEIFHDNVSVVVRLQKPVCIVKVMRVDIFERLPEERVREVTSGILGTSWYCVPAGSFYVFLQLDNLYAKARFFFEQKLELVIGGNKIQTLNLNWPTPLAIH